MGIEQDGLGAGELLGIFYEGEACPAVAQGYARGAQEGPGALAAGRPAVFRRLIAMELQRSACHISACSYHIDSALVDEQQHGCDKRRQACRQLCRTRRRHGTRARRIHHKTDGVGPGGHGRIHVLFARQPADLDACAGRGGSGGAQPAAGPPQGGLGPLGGQRTTRSGERGGAQPAAGPPQGGLGPLGGQRTTRSGERGGNIGHGSQSYAAVRAGRPHDCAYTGPRKYSPSGEKVGAATLRERACSTSAIHSGRWLP